MCDFSCAHRTDAAGVVSLSRPCGTDRYMAPEMWTSWTRWKSRREAGEDPEEMGDFPRLNGFKLDSWSAGTLLHLLLYGRYPYDLERTTLSQAALESSDDAKHLLSHLLQEDEARRFTVSQALASDWFNQ